MSVEIRAEYIGKLSVRSIHVPSGSEIITTAPIDNGGTGEYFSPTDLLATALGSCMLTIMGKVAERDNIDFSGARVKVIKEMGENPRRIKRLSVEFTLSSKYTDKERIKLENAAKTCPVKYSIHPDIEVDLKFNYQD